MDEPHPVDRHVGARLRLRRLQLGMSQERLGESAGVTFQQIQKYERGANRISASRLVEFAQALEVSVGYFFEGIAVASEPSSIDTRVSDFINSPDGVALASAWSLIEQPDVRRQLLQLIHAVGTSSSGVGESGDSA